MSMSEGTKRGFNCVGTKALLAGIDVSVRSRRELVRGQIKSREMAWTAIMPKSLLSPSRRSSQRNV
ncbi:MAG: hypothetical protein CTY39_10585 [Hyphomicrobium sp.]|nr:MAG: hypothetical protein CTY39_10585 [Hyphomicrobium sp.]